MTSKCNTWQRLSTAELKLELFSRGIKCRSRNRVKMINKLVYYTAAQQKQTPQPITENNNYNNPRKPLSGKKNKHKNKKLNKSNNTDNTTTTAAIRIPTTFTNNNLDSTKHGKPHATKERQCKRQLQWQNTRYKRAETADKVEATVTNDHKIWKDSNEKKKDNGSIEAYDTNMLMFSFSVQLLGCENRDDIVARTMIDGYKFMQSCEVGDVDGLKSIYEKMKAKARRERDRRNGRNFRHYAYGGGDDDDDDFEFSISDYFDVDCKCVYFNGNSGLHLACYNGRLDCVKYLLDTYKCNIFEKNNISKQCILHSCAIAGHDDVLKYLLTSKNTTNKNTQENINEDDVDADEDGDDTNKDKDDEDNEDKEDKDEDDEETEAELIMQRLFYDSIDSLDANGTSPLQLAFAYHNYSCVELLLSYGADIYHNSLNFKSGKEYVHELNDNDCYDSVVRGYKNAIGPALMLLFMPDYCDAISNNINNNRVETGVSANNNNNNNNDDVKDNMHKDNKDNNGKIENTCAKNYLHTIGFIPREIVNIILGYTLDNDIWSNIALEKQGDYLKGYIEFYLQHIPSS